MEPTLPASGVLGDRVMMDGGSIQRFMTQVIEHDSGVLDFKRQWEEYKESMKLLSESVRERVLEVKRKEEEFDLKQFLEGLVMVLVLELQTEEMVSQFKETMRKKDEELQVKRDELEAREKELSLKSNELKKKEGDFQAKQDAEARELEEKQKKLSLHDITLKWKATEMDKRKLEQEAEAEEIEERRKMLEVKEKNSEEALRELEETLTEKFIELEERKLKQEAEAKEIEEKRKSLEAKEKQLKEREKLLEGSSRLSKSRKRSRDEFETPSSALADPASASTSQAYEVACIDDEDDEDPDPYNCLDADFNNFNNTMSSFSVGQIWALYDPTDHMPRYYAIIRKVLEPQLTVEVTWLEPESEKPLPIACGVFRYGEKHTTSHLMFSHEMQHIRTRKKTIIINPRKGETWALFRDWKQHKRPYSYDFVQIESELDSCHGIGVAYLGRVEGFTSVYKHASQHGYYKMMIPCDEMLRFSHRVPSFELAGDDVPAGYFELDPAAIPRDYIEAFNVKEEEEEGGLGLSLVKV